MLSKKELVGGLPKLDNVDNIVHGQCQQGKQYIVSHKKVSNILLNRPFISYGSNGTI